MTKLEDQYLQQDQQLYCLLQGVNAIKVSLTADLPEPRVSTTTRTWAAAAKFRYVKPGRLSPTCSARTLPVGSEPQTLVPQPRVSTTTEVWAALAKSGCVKPERLSPIRTYTSRTPPVGSEPQTSVGPAIKPPKSFRWKWAALLFFFQKCVI